MLWGSPHLPLSTGRDNRRIIVLVVGGCGILVFPTRKRAPERDPTSLLAGNGSIVDYFAPGRFVLRRGTPAASLDGLSLDGRLQDNFVALRSLSGG